MIIKWFLSLYAVCMLMCCEPLLSSVRALVISIITVWPCQPKPLSHTCLTCGHL